MRIWNFGSINIDQVYRVRDISRPGETIAAEELQTFPGGKGLNQSVAIARAGAQVSHVGKIGSDGAWLKEMLRSAGADTSYIKLSDRPTGHAIIQIDASGENSIVIFHGANSDFSLSDIAAAFEYSEAGDFVLVQNEINLVPEIIAGAVERKLRVVFNPAPADERLRDYPLHLVEWLILNETEGAALVSKTKPDSILEEFIRNYPNMNIVLTLGKDGCVCAAKSRRLKVPALAVDAVDTTGAGDTFVGYFLAEYSSDSDIEKALNVATRAASISVTRHGAATSIPTRDEIK